MRKFLLQITLIVALVTSSFGFSQSVAATPPPPTPPPPPGLPIDTGVILLFFVALITGYFITQKIYKNKNSYK